MMTEPVPITMGSASFVARELHGVMVNALWFPPALHLQPHTHDRPVFGVMLDGAMRGRLGQRRYECTRRTVFTEPAGELHDNFFQHQGARIIAVLPDTTTLEDFAPFSKLLGKPSHFRHSQVVHMATRVLQEMTSPDSLSLLAVEALVFEMFIAAARFGERKGGASGPPPWLVRVREMLHDRFLEPLRLNQLAHESGVHTRHLTRRFRAHFGVSIASYVRALRLDWCADQLRGGSLSLSEIAFKAGFADQSHFTRAFRRHLGISPGAFRKTFK
jgi:AraC family transcriptional regulator